MSYITKRIKLTYYNLHCILCKKILTDKEISFCRNKLKGKLICYICQKDKKIIIDTVIK